MRTRIYAALFLVPAVLVAVSLALGLLAAGGPCPSETGGGC
jgi:hypothetical protein